MMLEPSTIATVSNLIKVYTLLLFYQSKKIVAVFVFFKHYQCLYFKNKTARITNFFI